MSRGTAGRYLGRLAYQIAEEYARAARAHNRPIKSKGEAAHSPFFVQSVNEEWHREEKQHRKEEKDFWQKSLRYTAVAGVAATVAAGFAIGGFMEARRQAIAAEAQNRPWISVEKLSSYTFSQRSDKSYFDLGLDLIVKNVGHSPATRVYAYSTFKMFGTEYDSELAGARKICEEAKRPARADWIGTVVFPDDANYIRSITAKEYDRLANVFDDREKITLPKKDRMAFDAYLADAAIEVVGCVLYSDGSGQEYRTSYDFVAKDIDISLPKKPDKVIPFGAYVLGGKLRRLRVTHVPPKVGQQI